MLLFNVIDFYLPWRRAEIDAITVLWVTGMWFLSITAPRAVVENLMTFR